MHRCMHTATTFNLNAYLQTIFNGLHTFRRNPIKISNNLNKQQQFTHDFFSKQMNVCVLGIILKG